MYQVSCSQCQSTFSSNRNLARHIKSVHDKKSFSCDQCNNVTIQICKDTIKQHNAEKPFKCNTCKNTFKISDKLHLHTSSCKAKGFF